MAQRRNTIRVYPQILAQYDFLAASRQIKCAYGVVVVEMMPRPTMHGSLYLPEKSPRDDTAMVMAACPSTGYIPGTYVVINYESGKVIENFRVGTYHAKNEVRIFGRQPRLGETREKELPRWKAKMRAILNRQIFGILNVDMQQIYDVVPFTPLPICKRTSIDTYESYVRVHPLEHIDEVGNSQFIVQSLYGEKFHTSVELDWGNAYRLTVKDDGGGFMAVKVEILGDDSMTTALVAPRRFRTDTAAVAAMAAPPRGSPGAPRVFTPNIHEEQAWRVICFRPSR